MRPLFFLLLLANATLFGYIQLDRASAGEGVRLHEQVQPDKIRLLSPQQVAALAPDKSNALPDVCAQWGPFNEAERTRALAELEPLDLGALIAQKRAETTNGYWVYIAPFATRTAAERRVAELKAQGVRDVSMVDNGAQPVAVSLGIFRNEDTANAHLADLVRRGIADARAGPRQQVLPLTVIVIRDPPAPAIARLKELQAAYPGAELRIGGCEKAP